MMHHIPIEMLVSAYNQQLFLLMAKQLHTWHTPLLNMDVLAFWLMVVMYLLSFSLSLSLSLSL